MDENDYNKFQLFLVVIIRHSFKRLTLIRLSHYVFSAANQFGIRQFLLRFAGPHTTLWSLFKQPRVSRYSFITHKNTSSSFHRASDTIRLVALHNLNANSSFEKSSGESPPSLSGQWESVCEFLAPTTPTEHRLGFLPRPQQNRGTPLHPSQGGGAQIPRILHENSQH